MIDIENKKKKRSSNLEVVKFDTLSFSLSLSLSHKWNKFDYFTTTKIKRGVGRTHVLQYIGLQNYI